MSVAWQQKTHGVLTRREHINPTTARLFGVGGVVVAVMMALYLALSASTIALSVQTWTMHNDLALILRENSRLETEIARNGSIPVLIERSVRMGFVPAESIEYVPVGAP